MIRVRKCGLFSCLEMLWALFASAEDQVSSCRWDWAPAALRLVSCLYPPIFYFYYRTPPLHFIIVESYLMTRNHFILCVSVSAPSLFPLALLTLNTALSLPRSCLLTCSSRADLLWKSTNITKFKSSLKTHYGTAPGTAQEELRHASELLAGILMWMLRARRLHWSLPSRWFTNLRCNALSIHVHTYGSSSINPEWLMLFPWHQKANIDLSE